jgi:hypothetical protein
LGTLDKAERAPKFRARLYRTGPKNKIRGTKTSIVMLAIEHRQLEVKQLQEMLTLLTKAYILTFIAVAMVSGD